MRIVTNNVPRPLIDAWDLTEDERAEFDYLDWDAIDKNIDSATFFRYRGQLYDLGEFQSIAASVALPGWDGYQSHSMWSGVVVRLVQDADTYDQAIVVGSYYEDES